MANAAQTYISRNNGTLRIASSDSRSANVNICDGANFSGSCNIITNNTQAASSTINLGSTLTTVNICNTNNYARPINIASTNAGAGVVTTNTINIGSNMSNINIGNTTGSTDRTINIGVGARTISSAINIGTGSGTTATPITIGSAGSITSIKGKVNIGTNGLTIQNIRYGTFTTGTPTNDYPAYVITHGLGSAPLFASAIVDRTGFTVGLDVFTTTIQNQTATTITFMISRVGSNNTGWGNNYTVRWMAFN